MEAAMILRVWHDHHYCALAGQMMEVRLWAITIQWSLPNTVTQRILQPCDPFDLGFCLSHLVNPGL